MKAMNKFGGALRVAGVVLVIIALVLSIYNLATGSARWNELSPELTRNHIDRGIVNRLRFDSALFDSMSVIGGMDEERTNAEKYAVVEDKFSFFTEEAAENQPEVEQRLIREAHDYFSNTFDTGRFAMQYETWSNALETREAASLIKTLDSYTVGGAKSKKKIAQTASCGPDMRAFYDNLLVEHAVVDEEELLEEELLEEELLEQEALAEEEAVEAANAETEATQNDVTTEDSAAAAAEAEAAAAAAAEEAAEAEALAALLEVDPTVELVGTYVEFLQTVNSMILADKADNVTVNSAKSWLDTRFEFEAYQTALAEVRSQEATAEEGIVDSFADLMISKAAGEQVDIPAFFQGVYATLQEQYPDTELPSYLAMLTSLKSQLETVISFDGKYSTILSGAQAKAIDLRNSAFPEFLRNTFAPAVAKDATDAVSIFVGLWAISSRMLLILLVGVLLIIAGYAVKKIVYAVLLNRMEKEDQQKTEQLHIENRLAEGEAEEDVLLRVSGLKQYFRAGNFVTKAVDDVNFFVKKGEVFGLVGESGCGKTTTGRTIINLYDPTEGDVYFQGLRISSSQNGLPVLLRDLKLQAKAKIQGLKEAQKQGKLTEVEVRAQSIEIKSKLAHDIEAARTEALMSSVEKSMCVRKYRKKRQNELTAEFEKDAKTLTGEALEERKQRYQLEMKVAAKDNIMTRMQMIFQDPIASINPRMTVREIIAEGLRIRGVKDKKYIEEKVYEMLELVGLVREHADRYPHEFSGGQRQRIGIARAIVMQPDLIIADEPISALDVSIQAQVINLLNDLRERMGLTILFIAHNLSVVKYFSDRIAVMYFGKIVELASSDELFEHPLHPYTKSLLSAIPYPDPHYEKQRKRITYKPSESHDYSVDKPTMHEITPGHFIYCNEAELEAYKKELAQ